MTTTFGANLRAQRKAKGLTQEELAEKAELSTVMISQMERGIAAPSFPTIERLSDVLEVPEAVFFGIGLVVTSDNDRTRLLAKIQTQLSRMNKDQLVRAGKLLAALLD